MKEITMTFDQFLLFFGKAAVEAALNPDGTWESNEDDIDQVFHMARHAMRNLILTEVIGEEQQESRHLAGLNEATRLNNFLRYQQRRRLDKWLGLEDK